MQVRRLDVRLVLVANAEVGGKEVGSTRLRLAGGTG